RSCGGDWDSPASNRPFCSDHARSNNESQNEFCLHPYVSHNQQPSPRIQDLKTVPGNKRDVCCMVASASRRRFSRNMDGREIAGETPVIRNACGFAKTVGVPPRDGDLMRSKK